MKLEEINQNVRFEEKEHRYFLGKDELTSVSKILESVKPKFDEDGHIIRACAKRDGLSVAQIQEKWDQAKTDGLKRGKSFHRQVEYFIKNHEILDDDYKDVISEFAKIKFSGQLFSEIGLHHPDYKIAGTTDLVCLLDKKNCELYDFKSNKSISTKSKYGNKLLYPLEHLDASEIDIYSLQLGIYKFMLEYHGFKIKKIIMYHINPQTRLIDTYDIPDIKKDVKLLLDHFHVTQNW